MPHSSVERRLRAVLLPLLVAAALAGCKDEDKKQQAGGPPPPPEVDVFVVHARPVALRTELPGRLSAYRTAEVRPQVGGVILHRLFTEGDTVQAGQVLYQIDPAPYEATLASAQAQLQKAQASLKASQALANRYKPLVAAQAISRQDLDNAQATLGQNQADIASAQAAIKSAQINLAYTRVSSPITGKTGRSAVTEGALVTANQTTSLVTVTQLDPIYVDAQQPTSTMLRLRREAASGQIKAAGTDGIPVTLRLEDGTPYEPAGRLQFSEVTVDQSTGAVTLRSIFPNPTGLLLPGMFVQEVVEEGTRKDALLVPQQGVTHNEKGEAVALLVGPDNKVSSQVITTERAIGDAWLVSAGLKDGARVIVKGVQKVKPGAVVKPNEVQMTVPGQAQGAPAPAQPAAK